MAEATCTIVVDNQAAEGLAAEHGFALRVATDTRTILFDTGSSGGLALNSERLHLDLSEVTDLVLSHGHYDHTGGVAAVLERSRGVRVYLHPAALRPRYALEETGSRGVGMPLSSARALEALPGAELHWLTGPHTLGSAVGLSGPIPRLSRFEDTGGPFFLDKGGRVADLLEDETCMWLRTTAGLVVCVGCSHAGIVNTIRAAQRAGGEERVAAVIGGLHLHRASDERLRAVAEALNGMAIGEIIVCHCTGEQAAAYLQHHVQCRVSMGYAGLQRVFQLL